MSAMASQITSLTIVCSTVYSRRRSKKTSKLCVTGLFVGNSPVTGEFPTQRASNAENVSIWWRHHDSHYKGKTASRPPYLYHGNPYTRQNGIILKRHPDVEITRATIIYFKMLTITLHNSSVMISILEQIERVIIEPHCAVQKFWVILLLKVPWLAPLDLIKR